MKRAMIPMLMVTMALAAAACSTDDKGEDASASSSVPVPATSSPGSGAASAHSATSASMDHSSMDHETSSATASAAANSPAVTSTTLPSPTSSATSPSPSADGTVINISFTAGKVTIDDKTVQLKKGTKVTLVVTSDVADEVHVHGYDIKTNVAAGATVALPFTADQPGSFEVELEKAGVLLVKLQVK